MAAVLASLFLVFFYTVNSQVYSGTPTSFSATYDKFNPSLQGGGVTKGGTINYDGTKGAFELKYSLSGTAITEVFQFSPPFPSGGLATQCTPTITSTPANQISWNTILNFDSVASDSAPSPAAPATGTAGCANRTNDATCAVGSRIYATQAAGNSITYRIDRYDDSSSPLKCGCNVATVCIPLPQCVACTDVTVTGATINCAPAKTPDCTGVDRAAVLTVTPGTPFTVTMPRTTIGYGPIGLQGSAASTTCVSCPTAVHTCSAAGSGVAKYKKVPSCTSGAQCELNDNSDMLLWPLWYSPDYYNPPVSSSVSFKGTTCQLYTAKSSSSGTNMVVNLWLTNGASNTVCQFETSNGDIYTMTSVTPGAVTADLKPNCLLDSCWRPLNIAFIIELTSFTTFQDVTNMRNWLLSLSRYLRITPPETNVAIVTYNTSGVNVDLSLGANTQQLQAGVQGGLRCCNAFTGDTSALCCSRTSSHLPAAITTAATLLKNFPDRTYTSKNIFLLTAGGFTNTATEIDSALASGSLSIRSQAASTSPPGSAILNFEALYFGKDKAVLDTLNTVKNLNKARNANLYTLTQLSTKGLASGFDVTVDRVFNRPKTSSINDDMKEIVGGLCATNGGRSCGACCGECTCGTICAPPNTCKSVKCYNVTLQPQPTTSSTCCNYKLFQCPGSAGTSLCNSIICDLMTDQCRQDIKTCPASNACYNYNCNPATGSCDSVAKFSDPNLCYKASCSPTNTIVYTKKYCDPRPCHTVSCVNSTGECVYTPFPKNPSNPCLEATCVNNAWVYDWPASCKPANPCLQPMCDQSNTCITVPSCGVDTGCLNVTCTSTGRCIRDGCPLFATTGGTVDRCKPFQKCTAVPGASLYSNCEYSTKSCPVTDPACQRSRCVSATGNCLVSEICPPHKNNDACQPRITGQCSNATGIPQCNYSRVTCSFPDPCKNTTCNPSNAQCGTYQDVCATFLNGNMCRPRITASCSAVQSGTGTCQWDTLTCAPNLNPCKNNTCNPSTGCTYPDVCPQYQGGNMCIVRNDSTCVAAQNGGTCSYITKNCTPSDPCMSSTCQSSSGRCTAPTQICPLFANNNADRCSVRVNSSCANYSRAGKCFYVPSIICTAPNAWTTTTCETVRGIARCVDRGRCPLFKDSNQCLPIVRWDSVAGCIYGNITCNSTNVACSTTRCNPTSGVCEVGLICQNLTSNRCSYTTSCNAPCIYQNSTCQRSNDTCSVNVCDPSNGNCGLRPVCPLFNNTNRCQPRNSSTCPRCTYSQVQCRPSADACMVNECQPNSGECQPRAICPAFETVNRVVNRCRVRVNRTCPTCNYTAHTCPTHPDPCFNFTCNSNTGACDPVQICPLFRNGDRCFPRVNSSCPTCDYMALPCSTNQPCLLPTCSNGVCNTTINPAFNLQTACPVSNPCQVAVLNRSAPNCCSYAPKCPESPNKCLIVTCDAGTCRTRNRTQCPAINPATNSLCDISTGCNASTGACTFGPKPCPPPANKCQKAVCDAATGTCSDVETPACIDKCNGIVCLPSNCSNTVCNPDTGKCVLDPTRPLCPIDNQCAIGTCNPINNFCLYRGIIPQDCETQFGPPGPCFYWGTNPTFRGCCQKLPLCNAQIDSKFQCMLLTCNNNTDGKCVLVDNTDNVCEAYLGGDICRPLWKCDNTTGGCVYFNKNTECAAQQAADDPCYDGVCKDGICVSVNTTRCIPQSPCLNVTCPSDACVKQACNETDGTCYVVSNTTCRPINNCTTSRCDPVLGCIPVPFDSSICNNTDPCTTVVLNGSLPGCCDLRPKCDLMPDKICNPVTCSAGECIYRNASTVCPPFKLDNVTQMEDKCYPFSSCSGGCIYSQKECPPPRSACEVAACNATTGECTLVDTCRNDMCVQSQCNIITGKCDIISTTICSNDACTNKTCIPAVGCVTLTTVDVNSCPKSPCNNTFLNPQKPGCCDSTPKCVPSNACSRATCNAGNCTFSPFCPPRKCQDVLCIVDASTGQPSCIYTNKTCVATDLCEQVLPCVEDNQPFSCRKKNTCPPSTDLCYDSVCTPDSDTLCSLVPAKDCNDNNNCTIDVCVNGTCAFRECPYTDRCFPSVCMNGTCVVTPVVCEDFDACTNDTCFDGKCTNTPIVCDDGDACTSDACDKSLGCVLTQKICQLNETCAYNDPNDAASNAAFNARSQASFKTPCRVCENNGNNGKGNGNGGCELNCDLYICSNQTCTYTKGICANYISTTDAIIGGAIGGGVLAGIIIAALVVILGTSGGAVVAINNRNNNDDTSSVMNNPLFKPNQSEFVNPIHVHNRL